MNNEGMTMGQLRGQLAAEMLVARQWFDRANQEVEAARLRYVRLAALFESLDEAR